VSKKHIVLLVICFAVLIGALSLGTSYARYVSEVSKSLVFEANTVVGSGSVTLTSQNGWVATPKGQKIEFTLSGENRQASAKRVGVRVSATELVNPDIVIKLTVGDTEYTATPSVIAKDSALYKKMGAGSLYRFKNGESELSFDLIEQKNMTVTVEGASDTALLRLCVDEI